MTTAPPASRPISGDPRRVFGLDALRAGAILSVISAHAFVVLYPHMPAWFGLFGHGGFYGVELFFVLSGFLIGRILIDYDSQLSLASTVQTFYLRRWFRTLPLFALFLLVNIVLEFVFRQHRVSGIEVATHGFFLRNFASNSMSFFGESWSLAIEEWFYLLFPAALWLGLKFSRQFDRTFLIVAAAFFFFSTAGRMFSAPEPAATWAEWQRKIVLYRFDALMTGVFAAWYSVRFPYPWRKHKTFCAILGAALLLAMYATLWKYENGEIAFGDDSYFARTFRFNLVSAGFALLLPAAANWKLRAETFASTAVRRIALWSYSLYLLHLPVFDFVTRFSASGSRDSLPHSLGLFAFELGAAIAASALLYHFFEAPCTRLREKAAPAVPRRSFASP